MPTAERVAAVVALISDAITDTALPESAAAIAALTSLQQRGVLLSPDGFGGTVLDALDRVLRAPLAPGLETAPGRLVLLAELLRNLDDPGRINQGLRGTCAATCVEVHLAERQPGEYARLVAGLVSPNGAVGLQTGDALLRDEQTLGPDAGEGHRSPVSRLFQVAAMEFAYPQLDYRNLADGHFQPDSDVDTGTGLSIREFDRLLEGITGQSWEVLTDRNDDIARILGIDPASVLDLARDGFGIIARSLADGADVFVTLDGPQGASRAAANPMTRLPHKVRVLALTADRVVYEDPLDPEDPWIPGVPTRVEDDEGRCSMARSDFSQLLVELSYRPEYAHPA